MLKLAVITTHPIQYNAPLFRKLAERRNIYIKVFYTWSQAQDGFFDSEFNKNIVWDIPLLDGYEYEFVENIATKPNTKHFFGIICPNLIQVVSEYNPDILLVYGWAFQAHLKLLKHFKGKIPIVFRGDSTFLDKKNVLFQSIRSQVLHYVYKNIDFAFFVGTNSKNYFSKVGLKEAQLEYLPYTIDEALYFDDTTRNYEFKASQIRQKLGISEHETVVAYIGKFIKKKNPVLALNAVQQYNTSHNQKIKLVFIGSGKLERLLRLKSVDDNNIFFLPFFNQTEMPIAYRIANIFVLPSAGPNETWGISVNEALACNRLVLVSNKVGGAVDMMSENPNGAIFDSDNKSDFIKQMTKLQKCKFTEPLKKSVSLDDAVKIVENSMLYFIARYYKKTSIASFNS